MAVRIEAMPKDDETLEALRLFIVTARKDRGLSQRDLAKRAGLSKGTIAAIEGSAQCSLPRQPTLQAIAKGLGVPYEHLDRIVRGLPVEPELSREALAQDIISRLERLPSPDQLELLSVLDAMVAAREKRQGV